MAAALESNIWKYTVLLVTNKRVFTAIIGVYYLTIPGVTPFWIGMFLLAGSGASFIFDIPSSYIADKIGHKDAIILSRVILILSGFSFLFATNVWWLVAASVLMSIGFAFLSGVGSAFMHETMRALDREEEYRAVIGKASSIGFFIPAVLATIIPFTVEISYKIPFLIGLVLDLAGLVVALSLVRPLVSPERAAKIGGTSYLTIVRQGLALRFFRIVTFSGLVIALIHSVEGFRGPYQLLLGVPVIWFGLFFGMGRVLASILLASTDKIHTLLGDVYSYQRAQIVVYGTLLLTVGLVTHPWVVVVVFILDNGLRWGMSQVDLAYQLDIIRDHPFKATLLSTSNQLQNIFTMGSVAAVGIAIEYLGYQHSFLMIAVAYLLILVPLHLWIYRNRNRHAAQ